jgi:anti-sigma regulatory factor (Ser/Thr protein kinase)
MPALRTPGAAVGILVAKVDGSVDGGSRMTAAGRPVRPGLATAVLSHQDERHAVRLRGSAVMGVCASVTLQEHLSSAGSARRFTARMCRSAGVSIGASEVAVLLTSELVANAIVHGHSEPRLTVTINRQGVQVEVGDLSSTTCANTKAGREAETGRGLAMVETCATRWGVRPNRRGKTVWFEVADTGPREPLI